jgi:hypothetical protein
MAVRDLEAFMRQRAAVFDPGLDVSPGSPFDVNVIQPLVNRLGTDPFTIDLSTFIFERMNQAFPELATSEGDAITDLLIKPLTLLWDPMVREIFRVKQGLSFRDASQLTTEEAEALGANIFANRDTGNLARGIARVFFANAQNQSVTPINFVTSSSGLHYFPTEVQSLRAEEMLANKASDGTYFFDFNVIAEQSGTQYNIEPNSLVSVAQMPAAVRVTNLRRFGKGEDEETAADFVARAEGELSERSLVTLRGISAKVTGAFPEVRRLNVVGFNDPEMERDVLKGGGLGDILAVGTAGFVDDDGTGQSHSRRFTVLLVDADLVAATSDTVASSYVFTVFNAFDDGSKAKDLRVRKVIPNTVSTSSIEVEEQVLVLGSTGLSWILRRREITLSDIPGGIIFPQGPFGTITVPDDEVHIGGATDIHISSSGFDQASLILDDVADNTPELSGTDVLVIGSSPNIFRLSNYTLGTTYLVTDDVFQTFKRAAEGSLTFEVQDGPNAGIYRVVTVVQVTGIPTTILTDPEPATIDGIPHRWKLLDSIDVELTDPRETLVTGNDLKTVQGSATVTTTSAVDFSAFGVQQGYVLRVFTGESPGDYTVSSLLSPTQIVLTAPFASTGAGLKYEVFRPNVAGALQLPLVRVTQIDVLDSSSQPIGTTIPYAKPIDIQSRAFQNPARGIKLDIRDARLGIVSAPVGVSATGTLGVVAKSLINDGETFTLSDGINSPIIFEYDTIGDGVTPGHVRIDISALIAAGDVATATAVAINGVGSTLRILAVAVGALVALKNQVPGTAGNQVITETVANPGFTVTGMSGGANGVFGVTGGDTLTIEFLGFEGLPSTTANVTFVGGGNLTLAQVITQISTAVSTATGVPNGAIQVGNDRFGIRPLRAGARVTGGTARTNLFGIDEVQTSWDVRSSTVDERGGWAALQPALDLESGIDVLQVIDGQQVGVYPGPYFIEVPDAIEVLNPNDLIPIISPRFAPEADVHIQFGARSIGSARCFFLEPTSIEFGPDSRFTVETDNGVLEFLPDPSLTSVRIPPPPETAKPKDGSANGGGTTFTSGSQDFVRAAIHEDDILNILYVPMTGSIALTDPPGFVAGLVGTTLVYSIDNQPDRVLTFIRDDLSLGPTEVSRNGVVAQINASVGRTVVALSSNKLKFTTDVSFVIRKSGTANSIILGQRSGLPAVARYNFSQADQANDSPHQGMYRIASATATTLTLQTALPSSGDYSNPVGEQVYTVERLGIQRISTTVMALNTVEPDLFYFDVELVSLGTGDQYNVNSDLQMKARGFRSDGYFLTTDNPNLSFSTVERPRLVISPTILENGVSDSPENATQLAGHNIQISYDRSQLTEDVNNFITSETERVVNESPLGRLLIPHFVRFALRYTSGSSEDLVVQDLQSYILDNPPNEAIESSDIQRIVSNRGATSIENPIDLVAIVHYPDRSVYAARSQDALTTGRLAAFIPDVLDVKRNTA